MSRRSRPDRSGWPTARWFRSGRAPKRATICSRASAPRSGSSRCRSCSIALTGGVLATQSALQPIRQLIDAVQRIVTTGRTDERVPLGERRDAIDELTALFNAMLDKIEGLVTGMRGALDNVSHDLRTPMTRLRGSAEMALAGAAGPRSLPRSAGRLRRRSRSRARHADDADGHLGGRKRRDAAAPRAGARSPDIVARAVGPLSRHGRGQRRRARPPARGRRAWSTSIAPRLEQVAANLLDNAIKYTPAGGRVEIAAGRDGDRAVLRVSDTGHRHSRR